MHALKRLSFTMKKYDSEISGAELHVKKTWVQETLDFPRFTCAKWLTRGTLSPPHNNGWIMNISHNRAEVFIQYISRAPGSQKDLVLVHGNLFPISGIDKIFTGLDLSLQFNGEGVTGEFFRPLYSEFPRHPMGPAVVLQGPRRELFSRYEGPTGAALKLPCEPCLWPTWPDPRTQLGLGSRQVAAKCAEPKEPLQMPAWMPSVRAGMGCMARFAAKSPAIGKKTKAADRLSPNDSAPRGVLQRWPRSLRGRRSLATRREKPVHFGITSCAQGELPWTCRCYQTVLGFRTVGVRKLMSPSHPSHGLERTRVRCSLRSRKLRECPSWCGPEERVSLRTLCITPCGLSQHGPWRSTALLFLPIAQALGRKKRLVAHPDPHHHSLARVVQRVLR